MANKVFSLINVDNESRAYRGLEGGLVASIKDLTGNGAGWSFRRHSTEPLEGSAELIDARREDLAKRRNNARLTQNHSNRRFLVRRTWQSL